MFYSLSTAYILWFLSVFGALGFHRLYLRKFPTAILWMVTLGLSGVGGIYDFFTLPGQVREANIKAGYRAGIAGGPGRTVIIREGPDPHFAPAVKESLEKVILRVAKRNGGVVSPAEVALESDYPTEEARAGLEKLAGKGACEMRVRPSGVIVFRFPEFSREDEGFEPGL